MAKNRNALKAGIFMVLSVAAAIAIVIAIAGGSQLTLSFQSHKVGFTLDNNIGGLRKGDDVRLGGLRVGSVSSLEFVRKDAMSPGNPVADSIVVTFQMPAEYPLASDAKVSIETSLTGVTDLNVSDLGTGSALAEDQILAGRPDAFTSLKTALAQAGPKLNADLDKIHDTLDTYDNAGKNASVDVHDVATNIKQRLKLLVESGVRALDDIHLWLGPSTTDFHTTVANVRDITSGLKEKLPRIEVSAQELLNRLNVTMSKVQGSMDDLRQTVTNARELSAAARSIIMRNQGRFDEIVAGIKKTTDNLDSASVEIRSSPWRLLYKPTPDEYANLNLYDATRQFADGANNLNDAALALRDALRDPDGDPKKVQQLYDNLLQQFAKFQQTEDALWKKVRE